MNSDKFHTINVKIVFLNITNQVQTDIIEELKKQDKNKDTQANKEKGDKGKNDKNDEEAGGNYKQFKKIT